MRKIFNILVFFFISFLSYGQDMQSFPSIPSQYLGFYKEVATSDDGGETMVTVEDARISNLEADRIVPPKGPVFMIDRMAINTQSGDVYISFLNSPMIWDVQQMSEDTFLILVIDTSIFMEVFRMIQKKTNQPQVQGT